MPVMSVPITVAAIAIINLCYVHVPSFSSIIHYFLPPYRFMEPAVITVLGGVLPFGSIFIEMYFIFTSFWAYKIYYVYGFMLLGWT